MRKIVALACMLLGVLTFAGVHAAPAMAGETRIAVAANFTGAAREIGAAFARETGHAAVFSFGATGALYAQIANGAPYDVFLAADQARPVRAEQEGLAVSGTRMTYAVGRLMLYSRDPSRVAGAATLRDPAVSRLAIANPATAPYGAAAVEVLRALGVHEALAGKVVTGNTIAQTYQFVATGNAEVGFVALSQVIGHDTGSRWLVTQELHAPIAQDAILLSGAADKPAARAFLAFLKSASARAIVEKYGYDPGD